MIDIINIAAPSNIHNVYLRNRAERAHIDRSREFLALMSGEEAGVLSIEDWSDRASVFIYEIFVLPSFRRQGVGRFLLCHAARYGVQLGCVTIRLKPYSLDNDIDQDKLRAWYARAGYISAEDDSDLMQKGLHARSAA